MARAAAPARRRQSDRVAESAERTMRAAIELINEKGFALTTAGEIGERAGYSRAMVRLRYGSKEALLDALFEAKWLPRLIVSTPSGADGLDGVLIPIDHIIDVLEADREVFQAFVAVSFETPRSIAQFKPRYLELWRRYEEVTAEKLRAGQRDGSVRADIHVEYEAQHALTYGTGLCYRWAMDWEGYDIVEAMRQWRNVLEQQLSDRPAGRQVTRRGSRSTPGSARTPTGRGS